MGAEQHDFAWSVSLYSLSLRDKAPSHEQADTTPGGFSFRFICTNLTAGLFCNLCLLATYSQWRYSTIVAVTVRLQHGIPVFCPPFFQALYLFDHLIAFIANQENQRPHETFSS